MLSGSDVPQEQIGMNRPGVPGAVQKSIEAS